MNKSKMKICRFCKRLKSLANGATYCSTCYRKFIRGKKECKRCHKLRIIVANGYCRACYNYLGGYYSCGNTKESEYLVRHKLLIRPFKCYFCNENRREMLDLHHKVKKSKDIKDYVLLCPNHHREVHLGWKKLS